MSGLRVEVRLFVHVTGQNKDLIMVGEVAFPLDWKVLQLKLNQKQTAPNGLVKIVQLVSNLYDLYRVYNLYNLYNLHNVCQLQRLKPIDRTPGIPWSDKNTC